MKVKLESIAGAQHIGHLHRYVRPGIRATVNAESSDNDVGDEEAAGHQDESDKSSDDAAACGPSPRQTARGHRPVDRLLYFTLGGD